MCIASFVFNDESTIITFNRDENKHRLSEFPSWHLHNGKSFFCPVDIQGGGTWLGYNRQIIATLQNGAYVKHIRTPPYNKSRGIILKNILETNAIETFLNLEYLQDVEPFSLTIFNVELNKVVIFRYDGQQLFKEEKIQNESFILCSCTLYNEAAFGKIIHGFNGVNSMTANNVLNFHLQYAIGKAANQFTTLADTVSVTQFEINHQNNTTHCTYLDLVSNKEKTYTL